MKTEIKKLKTNLHLVGDKVYSYETHVANIDKGQLIELGKFSKTTTNHIKYVAEVFGLSIVRSTEKPDFVKHEFGVNISKEHLAFTNGLV